MIRLGGDTLHRSDDESCISADDFTAGAVADTCAPERIVLNKPTLCTLLGCITVLY